MSSEKNSKITFKFDETFSRDIIRDVHSDMRVELLSSDPELDNVLTRIFSQHGKGIPPCFMALVAELVGGSWESLRRAAMLIEAIHLSSLLHDDVVDGSELRRGVATMNAQHSNKISVLFGDHIFISALKIASELENSEAIKIIHRAVKRMVEGEIRDTLNNEIIDEDTYIRIIGDKTASLFAASGEMGVVLSGVDGIERVWARELGESVGIAFQIIDDALDYKGNREVMGKPKHMDVISGNITLPLIYTLRKKTPGEIKKIFSEQEGSVEKLSEIVRMNGGIEYSYKRARDYSEKARDILSRFDNKKTLSVFDSFFNVLMERCC